MNQEKPRQRSVEEIKKAEKSMTDDQHEQTYKRLWKLEESHYYPSAEAQQQARDKIRERIVDGDDTVFNELFSQKRYDDYHFALDWCLQDGLNLEKNKKNIKEGLNNLFQDGIWGAYDNVLVRTMGITGLLSEDEIIAELGKLKKLDSQIFNNVIHQSQTAGDLMREGKLG